MLTKHFLMFAVFSLATAAGSAGAVFSQTSDPAIPSRTSSINASRLAVVTWSTTSHCWQRWRNLATA